MCKRVLFQLGIKKGKLCLDKMYIMIYIYIYKSGGNVTAQKRTVKKCCLNVVIIQREKGIFILDNLRRMITRMR